MHKACISSTIPGLQSFYFHWRLPTDCAVHELSCLVKIPSSAVTEYLIPIFCVSQLEERDLQEKADAERCQQRLQHLKTLGQQPKEQVLDWNRQRLPRVLADHLLRSGYTETADVLTESADLQVSLHSTLIQTLLWARAYRSP